MFGLSDATLALIRTYFASHPEIDKVILYGSRAMNTQSPGSDIDLAIYTYAAEDIAGMVKTDLEELPVPYLFDVTDYHRISYQPLREHIDRVGKIFYSKKCSD
jgi:uncharacterized protein